MKSLVMPRRLIDCIISVLLLASLIVFAPSDAQPALGLSCVKCTAKVNSDSSNDVMGGTNTRITWEGQAAPDQSIAGITLTMPEGTSYSTDNLRVTMLSGADLMTRTPIDVVAVANGQTVVMTFKQPAAPGGYFRVEIYDVFFPMQGGSMQLTGTYTLADGTTAAIEGIPPITVVGISPQEQLGNQLAEQDWVKAWNSNTFLRLFFNPVLIVTSFPVVFMGFLMAVAIVAVSFPLAIPLGLLLALMRISKSRILRAIASVYVNVVRGTPLFLQIYIAFFGLPLAGIVIPHFLLGVIVLAMNSSAYQCEIMRAGIQSIPQGQFEAARSLGMNGAQTMFSIIIPQTVRRIIPTMTNEFILLYKDTSMLAAVGVMEVVMYAKTIVAATGSITPYIVAAFFYLVITLPLARLVTSLERKLAGNDTGASKKKKKKAKKPAAQLPQAERADGREAAAQSDVVEQAPPLQAQQAGEGE